jgi:Leucine-rich repeat (LRR) protein
MKSSEQRIQELATSLKIEVDIDHFIDYCLNEKNEKVLAFHDSEFMEFPNLHGDVSFLTEFQDIDIVEFYIDQTIHFSSFKDCHSLQGIIIDIAAIHLNEVLYLPNLKTLCLNTPTYIQTTSIDFSIQFPNLEKLIYNLNHTNKINNLEQLTKLKFLSLNHGIFSSIDTISKLTQLEQLYLHQCKNITSFNSLRKLTKLTHLNIYGCNFSDLQVLSNLKKLEILVISSNEIQNIDILKSIPTLKVINASNNNITTIDAITELPNLEVINFSDNQITNLPPLTNAKLVYAYLFRNAITSIENLAINSNLQHLCIDNNHIKKITRLPKNLILFQANNNPIEELQTDNHSHLLNIQCKNHAIKKPENFSVNSRVIRFINLEHNNTSFLFSEIYTEKDDSKKKLYDLFKIHGDSFFKKKLFNQAYKTYEKSVLLKTISSCRKIEQQLLEGSLQNFHTLSLCIETFIEIKKDSNRIYDLVGNKKVLQHTSDLIVLKIRSSHLTKVQKQELNHKLLYKIYPSVTPKKTIIQTQTPIKNSKRNHIVTYVEFFCWIVGIVSLFIIIIRLLKVFIFR